MPNKQAKRRQRRRLRDQAYFMQPLSRKQGLRQVRLAARLAVRPERRQIRQEQRAVKQEKKNIRSYFPQFQQHLAETGAQTAAALQQAQSEITGTSQAASNYIEQLRQRINQEGQADAAVRGQKYDTSGSEALAAADASARNSASTISNVLGGQAALQQAYTNRLSSNAEREKVHQLMLADQRKRSYNRDLRALAREEGMIRRDELARLRDSERDFRMALAAARLDRRGQDQQMKLARFYRQSDALADARSLRNQLRVIRAQGRQERKDDKRARKWMNQGGGADNRRARQRARAIIQQDIDIPTLYKNKEAWRNALSHMVRQGVDAKLARKMLKRRLRPYRRAARDTPLSGPGYR